MSGLIPPLAGDIRLNGEALRRLNRRAIARQIAYVPQTYVSEFAYTVLDLVIMGRTAYLGPFSSPRPTDYAAAVAALDRLGIRTLAERDLTQISGGQRQLVLIARALAQESCIVVMDEPTASLDLANRLLVLDIVKSLANDRLAVVLSTHEPEQAFAIADRVAILGRRNQFLTGRVEVVLTSKQLSQLYDVPLAVERTPSGRFVAGPATTSYR